MRSNSIAVTTEQHRAWHAQFGEPANPGSKLEMTEREFETLVEAVLERQREEDAEADMVDSGIILSTISEHGFSGAFEGLVEKAAEEAFRSGTSAIRTVTR